MSESHNIQKAIDALEVQRAILGNETVDSALFALRERLVTLQTEDSDKSLQRKLVTILFADVSGFTALVEKLDPETVTRTMNRLWTRLDGAIIDEGGTIDKHMGDAVMAIFGAPTATEYDAERAVRASLKMQEELTAFVETEAAISGELFRNLKMRIGVNTGLVLVGPVGVTQEYTALGDSVNTASRIETATPVGDVMISHDTYRHVRGLFELTPMEPITVKGKSEPLQVYLVEGIRPRTFRVPTRGVVGVETPTVGREKEIQELQDAWAWGQQTVRVVTTVAEAGTGKSRLQYEFNNWLDLQPVHFRLFRGRATEDMMRLPFSLIRDIFDFQFAINEAENQQEARQKFEDGIREIVSEGADEQIAFLGHLIGLDYSTSPYIKGLLSDARQIRDRAYYYFIQLFYTIMQNQPAVIFLEDLHWADEDSLSLLENLVEESRGSPLLIVAMARPSLFDRHKKWGTIEDIYVQIDLQPLTDESIRELVDVILQKVDDDIPESFYELILQRADGNPFYVEEVIKMMIEEEVIETGDEVWNLYPDRIEAGRVPPTLTGVLQARLDGLPTHKRRVLQRASVVGRVFWDNTLSHLKDETEEDVVELAVVDQFLDEMKEKEFVFKRDISQFSESQEFIFKSAVLQDVTYESVLVQLRRIYHSQVANWLLDYSRESGGEFAGRIGEHFEKAGNFMQAADWYVQAGEQANNTYSIETAFDYYQRALALWKEHEVPDKDIADQKIELCKGLGQVYHWQGRFDEALEIFKMMHDVAKTVKQYDVMSDALGRSAMECLTAGDFQSAQEYAEKGEVLARKHDAKPFIAGAVQVRAWIQWRRGEPESALELAEEALAIRKSQDDQFQLASTLNLIAGLYYMSGQYERAIGSLETALDIYQELNSRDRAIDLTNNLGVIAESLGDYEQAFSRYNTAVTMAREIGNRQQEQSYLPNRGGARVALGDYEAAEDDLLTALDLIGNNKVGVLPTIYYYLARTYHGQENFEKALESAQKAFEIGEEFETVDDLGLAWRAFGMIASGTGEPVSIRAESDKEDERVTAVEGFKKSVEIFTELGSEAEQARTLRFWAMHEIQHGDRKKGEEMWKQAQELFTKVGAELEAARMESLPE